MVKSMTGYGRERERSGEWDIQVEVRSVNSRYLDLSVRTGRLFGALEEKLKSLASACFSRGKLEVNLTVEPVGGGNVELSLNRTFVESYVRLLRQMQQEFSLGGEVTVQTVAAKPDSFSQTTPDEDMNAVWAAVEPVAKRAFALCTEMRQTEGCRLAEDLLSHIETLEAIRSEVETLLPQVVAEANERMRNRVQELLGQVQVDESRLLTECAVFADKADVSEEVARLDSHLRQFRELLREDAPVGRRLDFLTQEINRECNTIGSKSADLRFTKLVLAAKNEVEKIREQVQNIE